MIAFPNQIKRIAENQNSNSNSNSKTKLKLKFESEGNLVSAIESNSNSKIQITRFKSLDDVFQPIPNGRDITATRDTQGIHLVVSDGADPDPIGDDLLDWLKRSGATMTELSTRYASLLIGSKSGEGSSPPQYVVRWCEHNRPNSDAGPRSWFLMTHDRDFWQATVFQIGFQWRARMVEPITCLVPPSEVRHHGFEEDQD